MRTESSVVSAVRAGIKVLGAVSPSLAGRVALHLFCTPHKHERPEWERKLLVGAKPFFLRSGLKAYRWGNGGPRVLLVHGWEGRGSQLATLAEPLVREGFEVIALDGPAHGESPGRKTNVHFFANALVETERELGGLHAIVAHSFGAGATILALGRQLNVNRVVLVASPSNLQKVIDNYTKFMRLTPPVARAMQMHLENWAGVKLKDLQIGGALKHEVVPALVVHDPEDRDVAYQNAEFLVRNWPDARLLTLEKVGHRRILKSPAFVAGVIEFLKNKDELVVAGADRIP